LTSRVIYVNHRFCAIVEVPEMPPKRKRARSLGGDHREEILRAARLEFAAHGYAGATTVAIAERAGVTQPLIHHHFGSKSKLWTEMLAELFGALRDVLDRANQEAGTERARIERLVRTVIEFSAERPELSRLIRLESASAEAPFDLLYRVHLAPLIEFFNATIARAEGEGAMRRLDHGFLYFALLGASTQLFAEPETARRAFSIDPFDDTTATRYADFIVDAVLAGLWVR
jgi:AcrR family transcriptional regulator